MIEVLLATYNSGANLKAQIDSILAQTFTDWRLLIRDAGSTDGTLEVIDEYVRHHPGMIRLVGVEKGASAVRNFSELMRASEADYMMFCDHDDVWLPDKMEASMSALAEARNAQEEEMPLLVFTDSSIVDENLKMLAPSMLEYQRLDPVKGIAFPRLLIQNVPSGHAMLFNRALCQLASPIPDGAVMHDHWVSLVAAAFGRIIYVARSTVLYRQHQHNVFGAFNYGLSSFVRKLRQGRGRLRERLFNECRQASLFLSTFHNRLTPEKLAILEAFSAFPEMGFWRRLTILRRHGIWKTGFLRNLGLLLLM